MLLGLIYSGYAIYASVSQSSSSLDSTNYAIKVSYAPTILNCMSDDSMMTALMIEAFLLVSVVVVWLIANMAINWTRLKNKQLVDKCTITAGDFAIMIENIPYSTTK